MQFQFLIFYVNFRSDMDTDINSLDVKKDLDDIIKKMDTLITENEKSLQDPYLNIYSSECECEKKDINTRINWWIILGLGILGGWYVFFNWF